MYIASTAAVAYVTLTSCVAFCLIGRVCSSDMGQRVFIYHLFSWCGAADIEKEKTHQSIFQGVTGFDKSQMRHTETEEKVALPAKEGIRLLGGVFCLLGVRTGASGVQ